MSLDTETGPAGGEAIPAHVAGGEGALTPREAANSVIDWRRKAAAETPGEVEGAKEATAEPVKESAPADTTPEETQPSGDEPEVSEPEAELPPIEPPRFWTKDAKERWASLPRETQEYIAEREQERDREIRRGQNEAAEKLKGLTAKEQAVEQARQQYESALPVILQTISSSFLGEFSDIKTPEDRLRLAKEDPFRHAVFLEQERQIYAVQQQIVAAEQRQVQENQQKLSEFMTRESELLTEKVPELADETQRTKLQTAAVKVLKDLDFKDQELGKLWRGEEKLSIHDHRFQLILRDAVRFQEAQQKAATAKAKPLPPVQKPGVTQGKNASRDAEIINLTKQLENAKGIDQLRIAARLTEARRRSG